MSSTGKRALPRKVAAPADPAPVPRPVLKWAGGKARLLPHILTLLPEQMDTYYEPFAGGAAVFFSLAHSKRFKRAVLSDQNKDLVDVYRAVKTRVNELIQLLGTYTYNRDEYYRIRGLAPSQLDLTERAARVIYLNRTGYNGLYRVNRSGQFNVPFGRYKNPKFCDPPRLLAASAMLKKVRLEVGDFETTCANAKAGDGVYFDPPYVPLSKTASFAAYHHESFTLSDQQRLAEAFTRLERLGVSAVLSNSYTPVTRELYQDCDCRTVRVTRPINSHAAGRGQIPELLVVTRPRTRRKAGAR